MAEEVTIVDQNELLSDTLNNLEIDNADIIRQRRDEITKALNKEFAGSESDSANRLMVGSWGRHTAIRGISDLDMLYRLPAILRDEFVSDGGAYKALSQVRIALKHRYPKTAIDVDRLVVKVQFGDFKFEVQPVFDTVDGHFEYPDTYKDCWKLTKPRDEIEVIRELDGTTGGKARKLCKLTRAWKKKHDVPINGLLIDTLVHRYLTAQLADDVTLPRLPILINDFFNYLSELPKQDTWYALGSGQKITNERHFQNKAKKAFSLCQDAIAANRKSAMNRKWRSIFGKCVPLDSNEQARATRLESFNYVDTEQFIEERFPASDSISELAVECIVTQDGFRSETLRRILGTYSFLRPNKQLDFKVDTRDLPPRTELWWKVLNRGDEAKRRNQIRGQIFKDSGKGKHRESTLFSGYHYIECYAIRDGVLIARGHVDVPII